MVKLTVYISMELQGVKDVRPADDDYEYFFTVQCSSCREIHPKTISFNQKDEREISGSKGTANFVWRCGHCKKEHSASFAASDPSPKSKSKSTLPLSFPSATSTTKRNDGYSPFISLDCRGLEFTNFHFRGKWACVGEESGTKFEFDLDDREEQGEQEGEERWDDYDEKTEEPVGVSDFKSKIERS